MIEERDLLIARITDWLMSTDFLRQSEEVKELIRQLEREHGAYPQVIFNLEEN
jgi:hypothetical protein